MADLFQLRSHTLEVWLRKNPIIAHRELVLIEDENTFAIGNGRDKFSLLTRRPFGKDVWEVLVEYGGYKGTREDFCRQLSDVMRMPEQQAGTLTNAGAGWNSFTFPREFVEECYVMLTVQDADCRAAVRNTTKQGFHYILHDASGNTTSSAILVNWMATAVSELNMAQAIAKLAGLNPFDYDDLTTLFKTHASEVVANEAAFGMVKRSAMASARYLCFLCNLSHDSYYNMVSIAESVSAMNAVCANETAVTFINSAPGAFDSVRLNSMAMGKYLAGLLGMSPVNYSTVTDLLSDAVALTALVADQIAMTALSASEVASGELAVHETACSAVASSDIAMTAVASSDIAMTAVASSDIAMTAVASSDIAMTAVASSDIAYNAIYKNSDAYATLLASEVAMKKIAGDQAAILALIEDSTRCQKLAASSVAMDAVAASSVARNAMQTNSASWKVVTDSNAFIAKFAIGSLDSSTYKPEDFANVAAIIANTGAFNALAASSTAMTALAASSTAMTALAASSTAMTALAASSTAMTALAASSTARSILWNNQGVAMSAINKVDMAIAKYAIGCLNSSSYKPANFGTMASVIANQGALGALAGSSVAMNALAGSSVAMNALAGSSVAMNALAGSSVAMNALAGSSVAMNALAGSSVAMNALAGSSVAMNALAGSSVARNALKSSPLATEKTNIVTSGGQYWSSDGTLSIKGIILYTTSGNTDNAFGIKSIDGKAVSNAGERNASTSGSTAYFDWFEAHPNESLVKSSITFRAYYTTTKIKYIPIN